MKKAVKSGKKELRLFYFDGKNYYKFFKIQQDRSGQIYFFPGLINSKAVGSQGNHFSYHEGGLCKTTLKGFQFKPVRSRSISQFKGINQICVLGKYAFEGDRITQVILQKEKNYEIVVTKDDLDSIEEPNAIILLLEPNQIDLLKTIKPYSIFLNEKHIIRYFDQFNPWVVFIVGSGSSADGRRIHGQWNM